MSKEMIKDASINTSNDLCNYLSIKSLNHNNFKYYAKREYINSIISKHSIFFSNGEKWNDNIDAKNLNGNDTEYVRYALCLSYSRSESIAMWLLYSGNDGCMIDYNKKIINAILDSSTVKLGNFNNGEFKTVKTVSKPDFKIEILDVIYYGESKKDPSSYYVKRSDETNKSFNKLLIEE